MTNSDVLVEVVVRAMREAINDSPHLAALHDVGEEYHGEQKKMLYVDGALDLKSIARAAIEASGYLALKAENDALREALDRIADVWTLQARVQPTDRKWHCQHEEWLSAAVEQARAALSGSPEG